MPNALPPWETVSQQAQRWIAGGQNPAEAVGPQARILRGPPRACGPVACIDIPCVEQLILYMKPRNAAFDPAPALGRGLKLLNLLHLKGACSLEQLVLESRWPKSSVLRLLQSLVVAGAVARDPQTLAYRVVLRLVAVDSVDLRLKEHCAAGMAMLCERSGHTVELHHFNARGLEMIDRQEPDQAMVRVVARVGWRRSMDEIDALTQVACAFGDRYEPLKPTWYWRNGRQHRVTAAGVRRVLVRVCRERCAVDLGINAHGVRRYAAPVVGPDRKLLAIVAVAQVCSPRALRPDPAIIQAVRQTAVHLSSN